MKLSCIELFVAVGISPFVSAQAHAQPLFGHAESIESTVANADLVVVGRLIGFAGSERADEDELEAYEGTIAVEEALKGEVHQRLRVHLSRPASILSEWKNRSRRLLVAVREEAPAAPTVIDLADDNLVALTAGFTLLRDPDDVLRVARETVCRVPAPVRRLHTFGLQVPREVVAGTKWAEYYATGGSLILSVPVDERLEERAQDYIRSESYRRREEGARALRYFKSDENVARVKSLLDDSEWAYLRHAEHNRGVEVRVYGVREAAYRTLKAWEVNVGKPAVREEVWKPKTVTSVSLSNTQVTDPDLKELRRFENLRELFLWNSPVTDAHLNEIAGFKNLRALYLGGTTVTDEGLKHLDELMSLRYLDLSGTQVTDEGLKVLAELQGLQEVDLSRTQATEEGVADLRHRRPDLAIKH